LEKCFVDSNVFFYAKIMDKEYGKSCARILEKIARGEFKAVTSTLALIELSNALWKYGLDKEIKDVIDAVFSLDVQIIQIDPLDMRNAVEIFDEFKISPYNCVHVAVMKKAKIEKIISADKDFEKVTWIKRIDPKSF